MNAAFAPRVAADLARGVLAAYAAFDTGRRELPPGWEPRAWLRAEAGLGAPEEFGFVAKRGDELVVAIRGTDSFPDLLADAEIESTPPPYAAGGARCDAGAVNLCASVQKAVWDAVAAEPVRGVQLVGHSLGGAVASLLALGLALRGAPRLTLTTFGSIRPGNWRFWRRFRRAPIEAWRVESERDLVPHWPPAWLLYRHVGHRVRVTFPGAVTPLEQHSMKRYCRAVEALAGGASGGLAGGAFATRAGAAAP
jgi:triacylglycerol lipase